METAIQVGDICLTNLSKPGGLVKVLEIHDTQLDNTIRQFVRVEHIEDHPYGYEKGCKGGYFMEDLIFVARPGGANG